MKVKAKGKKQEARRGNGLLTHFGWQKWRSHFLKEFFNYEVLKIGELRMGGARGAGLNKANFWAWAHENEFVLGIYLILYLSRN